MTPFVFALHDNSGLPRLQRDPRLSNAERSAWERELLRKYARLVRLNGRRVRFRTPLAFSRNEVWLHVRVVAGQSLRCPTVELHTVMHTPPAVEAKAAAILHEAPSRWRKRHNPRPA